VTSLTAAQLALLEEPNFGIATTLRPDASPHSTVVWVEVVDGVPSFNTAGGRVKPANLERDPRIALLVVRAGDFYTWLSIDGRAELTHEGAQEQIDRLSLKYDGKPWGHVEGQERISVRILPDHVTAYGLE